MSKVSDLERAKKKLAEPEAGNTSNVTPESFPLDDLPPQNDDLWNRIEKYYGLTIVELSALKNYACSGNSSYIPHILSIFLHLSFE